MAVILRTWSSNRLRVLRLVGLVLLLAPVGVFVGWQFNVPSLMGLGQHLAPMNPLTALCLFLLGAHVLLRADSGSFFVLRGALAGFVAMTAGARIVGYVSGAHWPFDQILFHSQIARQAVPTHMALDTAVGLLLLGLACLLGDRPNKSLRTAGQVFAIFAGLAGLLVLDSYALRSLKDAAMTIPMALSTALLEMLVAAAVLLRTPDDGFMRVVCARTMASRISRRLLWMALILPLGLSLLFELIDGGRGGIVNGNESILVTLLAAAFVVTIWISCLVANGSEEQLLAVEAKNRQAMQFLRTLIDAVPSPLFMKNPAGRFVWVNRACAELFGVTPAEMIGKESHEMFSNSEEAEKHIEADRLVLDGRREVRVLSWQVTDASGCVRWLQTSKVPIPDLEGDEINVLGISADVTERVLAEHRIEAASKEILDLYDNAPCGYHSLDAEARIIQMNETELDWLGYSKHEVVGKMLFTECLPPETHESFWSNYRKFQESGALSDLETTLMRKDGTTFPVVVKSKAVRDENGGYLRNRSTLFDLSERNAVERTVRHAMEEAERANRAKSEFLSRMSHELRTPLNAVLGFAQMLEMEAHGEAVTQGVQHILRGGRHLLAMINEILDLSRIDTGNLSVSLEPVELGLLLREVVGLVKPLAQTREVRISLEFPEQENLYVLADHQRLKQICINLLSNAIKYNVQEGSVNVSGFSVQDRVWITVADTGRGIPPERIRDLFCPFARLGAEDMGIEGTGLGLALSRGLAQYMRGSLTYKPNDPKGSVFIVDLAEAEPQRTAHSDEIRRAAVEFRPGSTAKKILLIEDNASNVELIRRVLSACGNLELAVAANGTQGVELAVQLLPDLVLLDVNLPDISGLEVLKTFKSTPSLNELKVVVTSADATELQIKTMLQSGALEYLTKPLDVSRLFEVLNQYLNKEKKVA